MAKHRKNKKKKGFLRSFLPWKGDSPKLVINKLLCLVALGVFIGCACVLLNDLVIKPSQVEKTNNEIQDLYHDEDSSAPQPPPAPGESEEPAASSEPERDEYGRLKKFVKLLGVNEDIVGWIRVNDTPIDLPVLQAEDNDFYLKKNYKKEYSDAGSIFLDYRNQLSDKCQIMFGHAMNSGQMFGTLNRYKSFDFYQSHPILTYDTLEETGQWKIISVFLSNTLAEHGEPFDYMRVNFIDDSDYLNFVYQMRIRSLYDTGVSFNKDDRIVLLSTCAYEFPEFRQVVVARKVRPGESEQVDISQARYNSKVVYPDIWYTKYGGSKPSWPATYEQAKAQGLLTWSEEG